jgi:hypothetical protein
MVCGSSYLVYGNPRQQYWQQQGQEFMVDENHFYHRPTHHSIWNQYTMANTPISPSLTINPDREIWLRGSSLTTTPGQLVYTDPVGLEEDIFIEHARRSRSHWNRETYVTLTMENGTTYFGWDPGRSPRHHYQAVWDRICNTATDLTLTPEETYKRVTGHVLFNNCGIILGEGDNMHSYWFERKSIGRSFNQNWWHQNDDLREDMITGIEWELYPQFIPELRRHMGTWECRVQHKADREGPCRTCRDLMDRTAVHRVAEVLL